MADLVRTLNHLLRLTAHVCRVGIIHDYILPLSDLARQGGRAVIFYDQLGNGRSTHLPSKPAEFWSITLFLAELRSLLAHLHIVTFDVCGHSWGGMLALELALSAADAGLRRVVCVSAPADVPHFMGECARLLGAFPAWVQEGIVMEDRERFRAANDAFDARHTVTTVPPPAEYVRALDSVWGEGGNQSVNVHMCVLLILPPLP
jgi:pimeloyl-ACP methyl ester carboxylesterase